MAGTSQGRHTSPPPHSHPQGDAAAELQSWIRTAAIPIATLPDPEHGSGRLAPQAGPAAGLVARQRPAIATVPGGTADLTPPAAQAPMVVTVAYHSGDVLPGLAADLASQSLRPAAWLLVNNAPDTAPLDRNSLQAAAAAAQGTGSPLPIRILQGREGEGFGAGCNRALDALAAEDWQGWVWLLNPDTGLPEGNEMEQLAARLPSLPQTGLLGTAVVDEQGALEASGGWIGRGLAFRAHQLGEAHARSEAPVAVDWLSGCSLLLRPTAQPRPPRFDPWFPLYYEDMDLCLRLAAQGAPLLWLPAPRLLHRRGSGSRTAGERRLRLSTLSYLRFLRRHCPTWVFALRVLRLLLLNLLRLPLRPRRSLAVLAAAGRVLGESLQRQSP